MIITFDQLSDTFFRTYEEYECDLQPSMRCIVGTTHSSSALVSPETDFGFDIVRSLAKQAKTTWARLGKPRINGPHFTKDTNIHTWSFTVEPEKSIQEQTPVEASPDEWQRPVPIRGFQPVEMLVMNSEGSRQITKFEELLGKAFLFGKASNLLRSDVTGRELREACQEITRELEKA